MLNLPTPSEFDRLLNYGVHDMDIINNSEDVIFHLGVISAMRECEALQVDEILIEFFQCKEVLAAHRIAELVGRQGYYDIYNAYTHPMHIHKERIC